MNSEHLLNIAEAAMIRAESAAAFRWVIVVKQHQIKCIPKKARMASETIIMELDQHQVRCGLTSDGWNTLGRSLAKYWKEQSL